VRVVKRNDPLNEREAYRERHEKSLIDILVPQHIEYAARVMEEAKRRMELVSSAGENLRLVK
jgi:hypothetical protein